MDRDKEAFSDQDKEKNLEASSDQEEESEKEEDTEEVPLDRKGEPVQTEASAASDREEEIPDEPCQESDEEETEETGYDNGSGREEALDSIQAENQNDRPSTRTQSNEEREERPVVRVAARPPRTKSARPGKISYVDLSRHDDYIAPLIKQKVKHTGLKIMLTAACMGLVMISALYAAMVYFYTDHFFLRTFVNGIECSNLTAYEVEKKIANQFSDYTIEVASRGNESQVIRGSDIGYRYISDGEVLNLLKAQNPYEWPRALIDKTNYTIRENVTFNRVLLRTQLSTLACTQEENQVYPEDAYITMNNDQFTIVPETQGSNILVKNAFWALDEAIDAGKSSIDFDAEEDVYATAKMTSDSEEIQKLLAAYNNFTKAKITYIFGDETTTLTGDTLKTWLEFDADGRLIQDTGSFMQHVSDYIAQLAAEHDTVGTSRPFMATDGRLVYVYGYAYGWSIDQVAEAAALAQDITSGNVVSREPIYATTANSHGFNDLGNTYIEVDMGNQHMYYYQNGYIIFDSDFVSGDITVDGHATPEGIYTLYSKQSPAILKGESDETGKPEYETEVEYWMPFNGGIGFHDASWQPYFGGDRFMGGGSHGCINLPYYAAAQLYNIIDYGVPIVCFY
ncbi:MAG: peptidoglycan binding domain-containing protein [Blautia sp.]|nr:peptidoglycan binding domain-containing protein [Blautia sp.]